MRALVTGITGGIGSRLAPRLLAEGHAVAALSRRTDLSRADIPAEVDLHTGDAVANVGLREALHGVDVAFYLIHSMEPGSDERFGVREQRAAENFASAARAQGVGRIVYLGGLLPPEPQAPDPDATQLREVDATQLREVDATRPREVDGTRLRAVTRPGISEHLTSRLTVERILLEAVPESVALRASIVIGARSRSFRFLVRLVERMPVLVVPAWRVNRTAPVDERDVLTCLVAAATDRAVGGRSLDLAGPDLVTYGELIDRIRDHLLLARPVLALPQLTLTPLASRISALIAGEEHALVGPLMEGLSDDLLPRSGFEHLAMRALGVRAHSLDAAIERALRDLELTEPLRGR